MPDMSSTLPVLEAQASMPEMLVRRSSPWKNSLRLVTLLTSQLSRPVTVWSLGWFLNMPASEVTALVMCMPEPSKLTLLT